MTDLSQFEFITYFSTQVPFAIDATVDIDYEDHTFILTYKYSDNSGAYIKCSKCNLEALICKISPSTFRFTIKSVSDFRKNKYSCNELVIKNLLE